MCSAWCWHEIDTVGKDVSLFTEGDQVFGFDRFAFGCYAECKCTAETGVLTCGSAKPSNLGYEQAAAIPCGRLTHKSALIRYKDWIWRCTTHDSPWGGGGEPVPTAPVRAPAERFLADAILVSGNHRQHGLPEGALLSVRPVADTEVHLLLYGLLLIEIDQRPALEAGPGAIFDPSMRTSTAKSTSPCEPRRPVPADRVPHPPT